MAPLDYDTSRTTGWLVGLGLGAFAGVLDLAFIVTLAALALAARF